MRDAAEQSSGTASTTASRSALCSATAFGTSSPSTTERYVRIANAMRKLTVADSGGSIESESSGSPIAPMRIAKMVIPTCDARDEPNRLVHETQRAPGSTPPPRRRAPPAGLAAR